MLTLVLVRHGETALNAGRRYQGRIDPPLSGRGIAQARALAAVLRDASRAAPIVHASDRVRALQTAALALPGVPVVPEPRLRELDFGAFDGRTYEENLAAHGALFRAWIDDPARVRPPGGETLPELEARIAAWLAGLPRDGHVIAFTHGGPIQAILARLLGIPFRAARRYAVPPGGALQLIVPTSADPPGAPPLHLRTRTAGRHPFPSAHRLPGGVGSPPRSASGLAGPAGKPPRAAREGSSSAARGGEPSPPRPGTTPPRRTR